MVNILSGALSKTTREWILEHVKTAGSDHNVTMNDIMLPL